MGSSCLLFLTVTQLTPYLCCAFAGSRVRQGAYDQPKFLVNTPIASGKLKVKLLPLTPNPTSSLPRQLGYSRFPSEPQQQATQVPPREQSSPWNSLSPSHLILPQGRRHWGSSLQEFTQPQRHKCASNPEPAAQVRTLLGICFLSGA